MDVFQKRMKFSLSLIISYCQLFSSISSDSYKLAALHITWPNFESDGNSLENKKAVKMIHACLHLEI